MAETLKDRLQKLRKREGLTLERLANKIDSTKSYIWELENKPNIRPSAEITYKLAVALNTTIGVLLGELEREDLPAEDQVFFRNYQKLESSTKKRLSKIMDALMEDDNDNNS